MCFLEFLKVKDIRYDQHGLPILSDEEIEIVAYRILELYSAKCLEKPMRTPIVEILKYLKENFGLKVYFGNVGWKNGVIIVGKTVFPQSAIFLDKEIASRDEDEGLFRFTVAHEIGHWILQSGKMIIYEKPLLQTEDTENLFPVGKKLVTPKDWMEHQANVFAASLLMPKETVKIALINKQKEMGIHRNQGKIYLDSQPINQRDFYEIVSHLKFIFGVSMRAMRIRLNTLGLIVEEDKGIASPYDLSIEDIWKVLRKNHEEKKAQVIPNF